MEIITVTAYAVLIVLALLGFRKLHKKLHHVYFELIRIHSLLNYASKREQKTNYILARHTAKLEKILRKVK